MFLNIFLQITNHSFVLFFVALILFLITLGLSKRILTLIAFPFFFFLFAIFNIAFGNRLSNPLIYNYGELGTAIVTRHETTNNMHNRQPVERYYILLERADGTTLETYFETWDFNIYPKPEDGRYSYPAKGAEFPVKYMERNPDLFVILSDEPSSYSDAIDCKFLKATLDEKTLKMSFDQENKQYQKEHADVLENYVEKECLPLIPEVVFGDYLEENKEEFENMDPKMQALFEELTEPILQEL